MPSSPKTSDRKRAPYVRTPETHRTRSDSQLSTDIHRLLIIDVAGYKGNPKPVSIAELKPSIYGEPGSSLRRAVCKRVAHLQKIRSNNPSDFW